MPALAVILDVDGVVSPVHDGATGWGDDVVAGSSFGPVVVSPEMCTRLDLLDDLPGVSCWWLTSWTAEMRASMIPFPGRRWPAVAERGMTASRPAAGTPRWWKLAAVVRWLGEHPELTALAWCDDELRGSRLAAVRRRLGGNIDLLTIAPSGESCLTFGQVAELEMWVGVHQRPRSAAAGHRRDAGGP